MKPLAQAIENSFRSYDEYFGIDAMAALSLPGVAEKFWSFKLLFCFYLFDINFETLLGNVS